MPGCVNMRIEKKLTGDGHQVMRKTPLYEHLPPVKVSKYVTQFAKKKKNNNNKNTEMYRLYENIR